MEETGKIKVLPSDLANLIAAGEVVEKPASVVKELVENSIDAGATSVTVEIREGGTSFIRVTDNGKGIPPEEMETAFLRHATSKLSKATDLEEIFTLGFRGEALAAIAAVSKIRLTSCREGETFAHLLVLEGGKVMEKEEVGGAKGTTITVSDLFFNTPARKKFMKTHRGEANIITAIVQEIAMSHPEVAVSYIRDGKKLLTTTGDGVLKHAVFAVLGKDIALGLRPVSFSDLTTKIEGFVSIPSCCRQSRNFQHFFLNGRYIKSPMLCRALEKAYENQKMVGKFPAAVLHITMDLRDVDVNVHPAKTEVKFAREEELFRIMFHGVKNGLLGHKDIQKIVLSDDNTESNHDLGEPEDLDEYSVMKTSNITNSIDTGASTLPVQTIPKEEEHSVGGREDAVRVPPPVPPVENAGKVTFHRFSYRASGSVPPLNVNALEVEEDTSTEEPTELEINGLELDKFDQTSYQIPKNHLEYGKKQGKQEIVQALLEKEEPESLATSQGEVEMEWSPSASEEETVRPRSKQACKLPNRQRVDWKKLLPSDEDGEGEQERERNLLVNDQLLNYDDYESEINNRSFQDQEVEEWTSMEPGSESGDWRVVGEFFRTYVVVEKEDEIFFIDKHAAHERLNFDRLKSDHYRPMAQTLITPVLISLSPEEIACVFRYEEFWKEFSFEIEVFSEKSILISQVPYDLPEEKVEETFLELVCGMMSGDFPDPDATRDHLLHTIACKSAIKAGYITQKEELQAIGALAMEDKVRHCPHGRPILAALTKKDLEKRFKRI